MAEGTVERRKRRNAWKAVAFIAPNLAIFGIFTLGPVVFSLALAFFQWDPFTGAEFVGFDNFNEILGDGTFWYYLLNTFVFMLGLPAAIAGSLFLAIVMSQKMRGVLTYRSIYYLPSITNGVALFLLWKVMYNREAGLVNAVALPVVNFFRWVFGYAELDVKSMPSWLHDSWTFSGPIAAILLGLILLWTWWIMRERLAAAAWYTIGAIELAFVIALGIWGDRWYADIFGDDQFYLAKPALMFMGFWAAIGSNNMLLYIAALTNVPQELYEAADIDGASRLQRFWNVTWPQLAPTTFFILVMSTIGGLQGGFEMARVMTQGGPAGATTTISYFIYTEGFETGRLGFACAVAWALFLLVFTATAFNWKFGNKYVND